MPDRGQSSRTGAAGAAAFGEGSACASLFLQGCAAAVQTHGERLLADGQAALERLERCGGPMDLLAVQQAWALSRVEAAAETTWRLWGLAFGSIPAAAAAPEEFRLPD